MSRSAVHWALAEGKVAGDRRPWLQARHRPAGADRPHARPVRRSPGVTLYEPEELVLTARAGTPIAEIEALVAVEGPAACLRAAWTMARCSAARPARGTIGGVLAANLSGPRRIKAGAARDHFLGLHGGVGARRDLQVRRPGGEERHRLRPLQADGRLLGHAGGADRGHHQDAAAAGNRGDGRDCSASTMPRRCRR